MIQIRKHPILLGLDPWFKGIVSRGNQITNTIGFQYAGHVITCEPYEKLITEYIDAHYKICKITGRVIRTSPAEKAYGKRDRPKIIFDHLEVVNSEPGSTQTSLIN